MLDLWAAGRFSVWHGPQDLTREAKEFHFKVQKVDAGSTTSALVDQLSPPPPPTNQALDWGGSEGVKQNLPTRVLSYSRQVPGHRHGGRQTLFSSVEGCR